MTTASKQQRKRGSLPRRFRRCCSHCKHCYWQQPDYDTPYVYKYCDMNRGGLGDKERMTSKDCPHYEPNDKVERRAPSTFAPTTGSARWKSNATWPDGETTTDVHDTEEQARAVCRILKRDGMGGLQEVYPTKTWVEPTTATAP